MGYTPTKYALMSVLFVQHILMPTTPTVSLILQFDKVICTGFYIHTSGKDAGHAN